MAPWSVMSLHQPASTVSMVLLYWPMAIRAVQWRDGEREGERGRGEERGGEGERGKKMETGEKVLV